MNMDYTKRKIIVTNQSELDAVPIDYHGRIYIKFGTPFNRAVVNKKYNFASVEAWENSSVVAWENSSVVAWENSSVEAWENSSVEAWGNSSVEAWENSSVVAWENSSVVARGNSSVVARGNSSVVAWENSSVEADGFAQACVYSAKKAEAKGSARLIRPTENINSFMRYHAIEHTKTKSKWYKAVHRTDEAYTADYDRSFIYEVGKTYTVNVDADANSDCGCGINMATLSWALDYGRDWNDLAIIEVEATTKDIVVPVKSTGKVRVGKVKVLREVPLEECGLLGKHIARRRSDNGT